MYDDEYDDGGEWGYDVDTGHDMWVDYTTDMCDDTEYSDDIADHDAGCEDYADYHESAACDYDNARSHKQSEPTARIEDPYEKRIRHLECMIAETMAIAALLSVKSTKATSARRRCKLRLCASEKQNEEEVSGRA